MTPETTESEPTPTTPEAEQVGSTALFACPDCGEKLYQDEADEGSPWYECEKCDFVCESDFNPKTGDIFPDLKANTHAQPPKVG